MRLTVSGLLLAAIYIYRQSIVSHGGQVPVIVSVLTIAVLMYRARAFDRESEKKKQAETQPKSEDGYSVEEWVRIRALRPPSEAATPASIPVSTAQMPASSPSWGFPHLGLGSAAVVTVCYLLLAVVTGLSFLPHLRLVTGYTEIQVTVVEQALVHQEMDGSYSPRLRVRYQAGGVAREQWCGFDSSRSYRSVEHLSDNRGLRCYANSTQAKKELLYPTGASVQAWYRPDQPEQVVVPDLDVIIGAVAVSVTVGIVLFAMVGVPIIRWLRTAWKQRLGFLKTILGAAFLFVRPPGTLLAYPFR